MITSDRPDRTSGTGSSTTSDLTSASCRLNAAQPLRARSAPASEREGAAGMSAPAEKKQWRRRHWARRGGRSGGGHRARQFAGAFGRRQRDEKTRAAVEIVG